MLEYHLQDCRFRIVFVVHTSLYQLTEQLTMSLCVMTKHERQLKEMIHASIRCETNLIPYHSSAALHRRTILLYSIHLLCTLIYPSILHIQAQVFDLKHIR